MTRAGEFARAAALTPTRSMSRSEFPSPRSPSAIVTLPGGTIIEMRRPAAATALALLVGLVAACHASAAIEPTAKRGAMSTKRVVKRAAPRASAIFPRIIRDDFVRRLAAQAPPSIEVQP